MISLVIPAYGKNKFYKVVEEYSNFFIKYKQEYEIIIVVDSSKELLKKAQEITNKNIVIIKSKKRLGKGGALIEGFRKAEGEIIGFVDADESISAKEFWKLIDALDLVDCAIASRYLKDSKIIGKIPFLRKISSRIFNLITRLILGLNFSDTQCGAKVFKGKVLKRILPELKTKGFEIDAEILYRLKKLGVQTKEITVSWICEEDSSFSLKYAPNMLFNLIKLRFTSPQ